MKILLQKSIDKPSGLAYRSRHMKQKRKQTPKKLIPLEQLIVNLRSACNPTADAAADRLLAADKFFKKLAQTAGDR